MKKKLLSTLFCLAILLAVIPVLGITARAEETQEHDWNLHWEDQTAVWNPMEGAEYYSVYVYVDGQERVSVGSHDLAYYDASGTYREWGGGTYTFRVKARVNGEYIESPLSPEKAYVPPVLEVGEPSNLTWEKADDYGITARWDAAEYAEKYILKLYKVGEESPIFSHDSWRETSYDFSFTTFELGGSGAYYFTVEAFRAHNYSGPVSSDKMEYVVRIPKIQNPRWDGYTAKWDPEAGVGFTVYLYKSDELIELISVGPDVTFCDLSEEMAEHGCGQYSFEVIAYTEFALGGLSDPSKTVAYHKDVQEMPKTEPTCTEEGAIGGTKCESCGEILTEQKPVSKLPHTFDATAKVKKATAAEPGSVEGVCVVCHSEVTRTIPACKTAKLSAATYTYDGKAHKPTATVTAEDGTVLVKDIDYTVKYPSGCKYVGSYKVTVQGKGDYEFTKELTFKINPVKTKIAKLTAGSKSFKVTWSKKTTQVTGYQIQYSLKKDFSSSKTVTVSSAKTTAKTIKKLKGGKTYYVRIRTYKTVGSTKFYSAWSAAKSVKTKK